MESWAGPLDFTEEKPHSLSLEPHIVLNLTQNIKYSLPPHNADTILIKGPHSGLFCFIFVLFVCLKISKKF